MSRPSHVQTFLRSPDFCAFIFRLSCVHQTLISSCQDFRALVFRVLCFEIFRDYAGKQCLVDRCNRNLVTGVSCSNTSRGQVSWLHIPLTSRDRYQWQSRYRFFRRQYLGNSNNVSAFKRCLEDRYQ